MAQGDETEGTARRTAGRKRDPARENAILDAAYEMLVSHGYDRLSFEGVASGAGAGRPTIYRRWSSKRELVAAALSHHEGSKGPAPDTGSVRGDLIAGISAVGTADADREAALIGGLIRAVREDADLRRMMRENVFEGRLEYTAPVVERGKRRGELPEDADPRLLAEVASALVYQRVLVHGEPVDRAFAEHCVDAVLLPLLLVRSARAGEKGTDHEGS